MQNLMLYTAITTVSIFTPGPGLLFTLTNTLNYRFAHAFYGVMGITVASTVMGLLASSGLGIVLTTAPYVMTILTIIGAIYLFYMGIKFFNSKPKTLNNGKIELTPPTNSKLFSQGFILTLVNPKPIIFYLVLFPQFIDPTQPIVIQFAALIAICTALIFMSHCMYGSFATIVRKKLSSGNLFIIVNRIAGILFMVFSGGLMLSIIR